jgi:cell division septation protein DedD
MFTVEELIGNLLLRHNCVIVPSFGGFVAKQTSATIDYKNGVMLPPRKSVLFNRQLVNNDGLLISEFAITNKVIYPTAEENVLGRVSDWNEKLRNGERVTLDRVGYLFYDEEKNICFEQDRFFNLLLESYGLGKVHFITEEDIKISQHISAVSASQIEETEEIDEPTFRLVSMPIIEEEPVVVSENEFVLLEHPEVKSTSKLWKYIAAAVLLPVGFYSFWLPMKTNVLESGLLSIKDFNPSYKAVEGSYTKNDFDKIKVVKNSQPSLEESIKSLPSDVDTYSYAFDEDTYIPVRISNTKTKVEIEEKVKPILETVKQTEVKKEISKPNIQKEAKISIQPTIKKTEKVVSEKTVVETKSNNFDFIVGSFATDESASILVNQLKSNGLKAYLITDNSGKHRVSAGSASTIEEIKSIAEKSKANGVEGWILRK